MENGTRRFLPAVSDEGLAEIMEEVTKGIQALFDRDQTDGERRASNVFVGTLTSLSLKIFDYLPAEQQSELMTICGTWFDVGMLLGKSPKLLEEILSRVVPKLRVIEVPGWLAERIAKGLV